MFNFLKRFDWWFKRGLVKSGKDYININPEDVKGECNLNNKYIIFTATKMYMAQNGKVTEIKRRYRKKNGK